MALEYSVKAHAFDQDTTYRLEPDRLVVTRANGRNEEIALNAIREVNLRQEGAGIYSTIVKRSGGSALRLTSQHFLGLGRFEGRRPLYVPFVRGLLEAASAHGARITGGSSMLYLFGWFCVVIAVLFTLGIGYAFMAGESRMLPMRTFIVVPLAVIAGVALIRQGMAKTIDPKSPPAAVFPA